MSVYADTSVLVSYYLSDANSARANVLLNSVSDSLIFTRLHRLEFGNALELGIFRGHYTRHKRTNPGRIWLQTFAPVGCNERR